MKRIIAALLGFSLLLITGCSQMNNAASVGETNIQLSSLQGRVDSILAERRKVDTSQMQLQDGDVLTRSQLSFMISNLILEELSNEIGIEISNSDIEAYKAELYKSIGGELMLPSVLVNASIAPEAFDEVIRRDLILREIGSLLSSSGATDGEINNLIQNLVQEKSKQLKIVINPRYGIWDENSISVLGTDPAGDAVTNK